MNKNNCDKCGQPVPQNNNAVNIHAIAYGVPSASFVYQPRHFLPTDTCPGSPSRAQYIEGQPRDNRGYDYDVNMESQIRQAYDILQKESLPSSGDEV